MKKIVICGYYGAYNRGDELILKVLTDYLKKKDLQITVTSLDPDSTTKEYGIRTIKSRRSIIKGIGTFVKEIIGADIFILGGGGLYQDYGRYFRVVFFYGIRVLIATLLRKKVIYFALGIGNVELQRSKSFIAYVTKKVEIISVRDEGSKNALQKMGVRKPIKVCADPVFTLSIDDLIVSSQKKKNHIRVGISLLPYDQQLLITSGIDEKIENSILQFCRYLINNSYDIVFIPMEREVDDRFINKIVSNGNIKNNVTIINSSLSHKYFLAEISSCDVIVGMRLHSIILSSIFNIPFVPISYHSKVTNTVKALNQDNLMILLKDLDGSRLVNNFNAIIRNYQEIKKDLALKTKIVCSEAKNALDLLDKVF